MRRGLAYASVLLPTLIALGACSTLPDITFTDGDAAGTGVEGGTPEGGPGTEGGGGGDAAPDVVNCKSTGPEICDDGVDNDCNGKTDCADKACVAFSCTDSPPAGWALVAVAEATRPACPAGYTGSTDLAIVAGSAIHTCTCTCTGAGGTSCAAATTGIATAPEATCTAGSSTNVASNTGATCTALPVDLDIPMGTPFGKVTAPAGPATCTDNTTTTKLDPGNGRTCAPPAKSGLGCAATQLCLPKPIGFAMCISKVGNQACPSGYTKQRHAGSSAADARTCTACSCNAAPCVSDVTVWSNAMCSAKSARFTTANNAACNVPVAGSDTNFLAKYYKSTIAGGCSIGTAPVAQGILTLADESTICCK